MGNDGLKSFGGNVRRHGNQHEETAGQAAEQHHERLKEARHNYGRLKQRSGPATQNRSDENHYYTTKDHQYMVYDTRLNIYVKRLEQPTNGMKNKGKWEVQNEF